MASPRLFETESPSLEVMVTQPFNGQGRMIIPGIAQSAETLAIVA